MVDSTRDQGSLGRRGRAHQTGSVVDRPRARVPKKLSKAHYVFIVYALENDDELTNQEASSPTGGEIPHPGCVSQYHKVS